MFGLGIWEIVIIVLVALIVLGPDKLPDVARQLGRGLKEIRRASHDLQSTIQEAVYEQEDRDIRARFGQSSPPAAPQSQGQLAMTSTPPAADTTSDAASDAAAAAASEASTPAALPPPAAVTASPSSTDELKSHADDRRVAK